MYKTELHFFFTFIKTAQIKSTFSIFLSKIYPSLSKKVMITLAGLPDGQWKWKDPWKGIKNKINWLFVFYCHFPPSTNPGIDVTPFDIGFINESNGFNNIVNILLLQLPSHSQILPILWIFGYSLGES